MGRLQELAKIAKSCGRSAKINIELADPNLIAEVINAGCRHWKDTDAQVMGTFHYYEVAVDGVDFCLETTKPVSKEEAHMAHYTGMSIEALRAAKKET